MAEGLEGIIALVEKHNQNNPNAGFATPIAQEIGSEFQPLQSDQFPNVGTARIREGLESLDLSSNLSRIVKLNLREDYNFEPDNNRSVKWVCLYSHHLEAKSRWDFLEIIAGQTPNPSNRRIKTSFKPLEIFFIQDSESGYLFGPFSIVKVETEHDSDLSGEQFICEYAPIQTAAIPEPFQSKLKGESYCALRIPENASIVDAYTGETAATNRKFVATHGLQLHDSELIDFASNEELTRWIGKSIRYLENPKEYADSAKKILSALEASELRKSRLWPARAKKITDSALLSNTALPESDNLQQGKLEIDWSQDSTARNKFVEENIEALLDNYPDIKRHRREHTQKVRQDQADLNALKKDLSNFRNKSLQAQTALKTIETKILQEQEKLKNIEDEVSTELEMRLLNADIKYREAEDKVIEKENEEKDLRDSIEQLKEESQELTKVKKQLELSILEDKERNTVALIKHASLTDALAGRAPTKKQTVGFTYVDPIDLDEETQVRDALFTKVEQALETQGRNTHDYFTLRCLTTSIVQNFITVLYGPPGSGKTSLARILSRCFCTQEQAFQNFVQVQRGWTNGTLILGYDNVLNGTRQHDSFGIFKNLELFNTKPNLFTDQSLFITLDEANLSPIEHYWSDFIGVTDNFFSDATLLRFSQNMGLESQDIEIKVPYGTRFLATINVDATTETLSDRFLSRAAFIRTDVPDSIELKQEDLSKIEPLRLKVSDIHDAFYITNTYTDDLANESNIIELKRDFPILNISPRKEKAIRKFLSVIEQIADAQDISHTSALDQALYRFAIPALRGSGIEYGEDLKKLSEELSERNMQLSSDYVAQISEEGDKAGRIYQGLTTS